MPAMKAFKTIDEYISDFPKEVQVLLKKMRETIKEVAPDATEAISYGIPTFKLNGNLVHFGGFKKHIGFFPGSEAVEVFEKDLTKYVTTKGTIQFQLDEPIPYDLVTKITKYRVKQNLEKKK
jgi:uncharacterized protein YdhG (YjbR/CyaY superfamily)